MNNCCTLFLYYGHANADGLNDAYFKRDKQNAHAVEVSGRRFASRSECCAITRGVIDSQPVVTGE